MNMTAFISFYLSAIFVGLELAMYHVSRMGDKPRMSLEEMYEIQYVY